jgi:hypothetical protein
MSAAQYARAKPQGLAAWRSVFSKPSLPVRFCCELFVRRLVPLVNEQQLCTSAAQQRSAHSQQETCGQDSSKTFTIVVAR